MIGRRGPVVGILLALWASGALAASPPGADDSRADGPADPGLRFRLFPAPPSAEAARALAGLDVVRPPSFVRLPGDPDSVFSLGGAVPAGQPRVRLAVEVNEVVLKALAPDPKVESTDPKGRAGGDWKPIDAAGRPYQLRFGARLVW